MKENNKLTEIEEMASMLDMEKNKQEGIDVTSIPLNSAQVINWKCPKGHTFKEKVGVIYKRKNKCFFCTGREIWPGENDLQTLYPDLAEEFDIKKNGITPDRISPKDTDTYWWTCKEKHPSFQQSVEHRVSRKTICPYCSGRKAITGKNDLETLFPEIASEWDHDKNGEMKPSEVPAYTYTSYAWICPKGHHYNKKVVDRTKFGKPVDCPKCVKAKSTSFPEQAIFYYVKKCFPDAINRYKEPFKKGMELDIYLPTFRLGIEYDGAAFHKSEEQHDREYRKYIECKKLGIKLVRIKETTETSEMWSDTADDIYYVSKTRNNKELAVAIWNLFQHIFFFTKYCFKGKDEDEKILIRKYGFPTDFNVLRDRTEILEYLVDIESSFGVVYPELAKMWSKEGNGELTPFMFTAGSNYLATWECPLCGKRWESPIASIVSRKVKTCKACSMKENGKNNTVRKTIQNGSLAEKSKLLLRQWDSEENGLLSPYEIPINYTLEVAWKCDVCGYKWRSAPNARVRKDHISGCPHCTGRVAMPGVDDLETMYPEIAREWDYEKNKGVIPSEIKPFSNKKYYWICSTCGNSYASVPGNRVNGHGCPKCAQKKVGKKNSKTVGQYDIDGLLINTYEGLHEAARVIGVNPNAIFQAVKGGTKSKGFYWHYINEKE